jgi:hypothetical protein
MPALLVQNRKHVPNDYALPATVWRIDRREDRAAVRNPAESRQAKQTPSAILSSSFRAAIIVPMVVAGLALVLTGLVPALFATVLLLLVGLAPILLVALAILLTAQVGLPKNDATCREAPGTRPNILNP